MKGDLVNVLVCHVFAQVDSEILLGSEFYPDIDPGLFLDVSDNWVKLEIFLSLIGLNYFEAHRNLSIIVKDQFLPVNMVQQTNLKVIQVLLNTNRNFCACSWNLEFYRWWVNKIADINLKFSLKYSYFAWDELESQNFLRVPFNARYRFILNLLQDLLSLFFITTFNLYTSNFSKN